MQSLHGRCVVFWHSLGSSGPLKILIRPATFMGTSPLILSSERALRVGVHKHVQKRDPVASPVRRSAPRRGKPSPPLVNKWMLKSDVLVEMPAGIIGHLARAFGEVHGRSLFEIASRPFAKETWGRGHSQSYMITLQIVSRRRLLTWKLVHSSNQPAARSSFAAMENRAQTQAKPGQTINYRLK
jgi:hypothetical protein